LAAQRALDTNAEGNGPRVEADVSPTSVTAPVPPKTTVRASWSPERLAASYAREAARHRKPEVRAAINHYHAAYHKRRREKNLTYRIQIIRGFARRRAKQKGVPFDAEAVTDFLRGAFAAHAACPACGRPFNLKNHSPGAFDSPSLDRLRPERGYVEGNLALICWRCNMLKRDATLEELESVVRWLRSVLGR